MGSSNSKKADITREILEEYAQLTYLNKAEILHIFRLFKSLAPQELVENFNHRLPAQDILKVLPQLRYNPFRESILQVFSSEQDGRMSFEDLLDLCSAMSDKCPEDVRAGWAFRIFDFDGDNQLSIDDLIEAVERITGFNHNGRIRIDRDSAEFVAQVVLEELDLDRTGSVGLQEFVHTVVRMPEFGHTFRLNA
ncbi:calcium and integrin-binding protein 1 [Diachasma alloeum]|uniref:calcium and integrin-binding protein 1 n=1 Tax=Diachasma alloeum TaxID=454923 RepID=UPI00073841AE|nr:calcium and integrin-binding protein 1 [Diachasma alloeum]